MKLLRDVICQMGKGYGYPLVSATIVTVDVFVPLAKGKAPQQIVTTNPWEKQANELEVAWQHNRDVLRNPQQIFPGQMFASFSPQTEQALNMTEQRALAGSDTQRAANQQLQNTLNGNYLYGGPGFDAAFQAAANKITPQVQSGFNKGGRLNSGLSKVAETQALADAFAGQYGQERQNQLKAMLFAPQAAEADYADLARLAGVGQAREGQAQSQIEEQMARHDFQQKELQNRIAAFLAPVVGSYGNEQVTQGFKGNKGAGILGGALGGAAAGAPLGPWGAAGGAGIGGLLGAFT